MVTSIWENEQADKNDRGVEARGKAGEVQGGTREGVGGAGRLKELQGGAE